MKVRSLSSISALLLSCTAACGESDADPPVLVERVDSSVVREDGAIASCDQAPDGTPCGDGGTMHCLYGACVLNVCGDGVVAGNEACDDGDQDDGNSCNSRCQEPTCGNGFVDGRDQCDDANSNEDDGCSSTCRLVIVKDAGFPDATVDASRDAGDAAATPQDAQVTPLDAQVTPQDAQVSPPDAQVSPLDAGVDATAPDASVCRQCVTSTNPPSPCRDWFGAGDMVAGCLNNPDPVVAERCLAAVRCGLASPDSCAKDPAGLTKCYCGETSIDSCFSDPTKPPAGRCIAQVNAITGCTTPACVGQAINDATETVHPAAYFGRFLLQCAAADDGCGPSCPIPQTTF